VTVPVPHEPPSVLVVDDDEQDRILLATALRREGYRAVGAAAAEEARALLEERAFALVVCDVRMPGESGVSLARHVATTHPGTAVIVVTGSADPFTTGVLEGVAPVMVKPFSVEEFLLEVAGTLVRRDHTSPRPAAPAAVGQRARELVTELVQAEDRERRRIAAELHDDTLQVVVAAMMRLERLESRLHDDELAAADIGEVRRQLGDAVDRARLMLFELHPHELDAGGLPAAIPTLVQATAAEAGIACRVAAEVGRFPAPLEQLVFRTVREALVNVRKHAHATRVAVVLRTDGAELTGSVIDDGIGFDFDEVQQRPDPLHFGLHSLAGRIEAAGGQLWIETGPAEGTALRFAIPAEAPNEAG